ncbi:DUF2786 domain-containing protein [Myxococcota bacterium]|nr:DUF2786 domain-containing protein [Myxococcota bacterium]
MGAPEQSLVERVEKLFALATSSNPHEAIAAARAAQVLVSKYRLEAWLAARDEVAADPDPITDGRDAPIERARRIRTWKRVLASALADVNGGAAWVFEAGAEELLCIVARARDRAVVEALYRGLVKRIEWSSATAGVGRPRAWHEAFRIGVVDAIVPRLAEAEAEVDAEVHAAPASAGALVRIDRERLARDEALDHFLDAHFGPKARGRGLRVDARAYDRGRTAGAELPLPRRSPE